MAGDSVNHLEISLRKESRHYVDGLGIRPDQYAWILRLHAFDDDRRRPLGRCLCDLIEKFYPLRFEIVRSSFANARVAGDVGLDSAWMDARNRDLGALKLVPQRFGEPPHRKF